MDTQKYIVLPVKDAEAIGTVLAGLPWATANESIVMLSNNVRLDEMIAKIEAEKKAEAKEGE